MKNRTYVAIDLKSFYASVECMELNLNPLTTNLVVADSSRTEKTICLAVSPAFKAYGIGGRARLFEVNAKIREINKKRKSAIDGNEFIGKSADANELASDPKLELDVVVAKPRMAKYIEYSSRIYSIYLRYIAPEDIHVYSIDEVFMDVTDYLDMYNKTPRELTRMIIGEVLDTTGITATAGIGTNLYLCKVAMDIVAKHIEPDSYGVRIAELDEISYREKLWNHTPITDFWRVGRGYQKKLEEYSIYTMGDICRCALGKENDYLNEDVLYKLFGVNAELLIDHAFGYEPCTIAEIKNYTPESNSVSSGQVLMEPYDFESARMIVKEMVDLLILDLVSKKLVTNQIVLHIGFDAKTFEMVDGNNVEKKLDYYNKVVPRAAHGSVTLKEKSSSTRLITEKVLELYENIVDKNFLIRRINVTANNVSAKSDEKVTYEQLDIFSYLNNKDGMQKSESKEDERSFKREESIQNAMLNIKEKYGKNAIMRGSNLLDKSTMIERNNQIGGHKA